MNRPFNLLRPEAGDQQDHQLGESRADCAAITQVLAHPLRVLHQLGAAQQRHERADNAAARSGNELGSRTTLRFSQRRRMIGQRR